MKKSLFFVATAAVVLASCSSDVKISENVALEGSNAQKEIAFTSYAQKPRRAADTCHYAIDGTTFPTKLNMYVAAYQVKPTAINYFAGTQFTYKNASAKWGGVTPKYWPLDSCYINFLAYANVTGTAAFDATDYASAAVITQTDNSSAQTDLMYAIGNGAVTKTGNTLAFPESVPMQFFHAQAWMDFYVVANSDAEEAITINSITLKGAKYSGTYTITHTNYNQKTGQSVAGAWTLTASQKDVVVPGWTPAALTQSLVQVGKGLMIVPDDNASTADWSSFVINYSFNGSDYNYEYALATDAAKSVAQKTHYVFNITFKLHEILVSATVADWTDAPASNITVQD